MHIRRFIGLGLLLAVLAACAPRTTPQATTLAPTATPVPPTSTPRPATGEVEMGFTPEGWPYRGNANATVTLWEFSEFQ